jgi:hypothetical protein
VGQFGGRDFSRTNTVTEGLDRRQQVFNRAATATDSKLVYAPAPLRGVFLRLKDKMSGVDRSLGAVQVPGAELARRCRQ